MDLADKARYVLNNRNKPVADSDLPIFNSVVLFMAQKKAETENKEEKGESNATR